MIHALIISVSLITLVADNPFSSARSISVKMHKDSHQKMCQRNWWVDQGDGPIQPCGTDTNERPIPKSKCESNPRDCARFRQ